MKTIEHIEEQKRKAEDILNVKSWLKSSEQELSKINLKTVIRDNATIRVFNDSFYSLDVNFQITLPELAILLQRRVDNNKERLEKLLNDF